MLGKTKKDGAESIHLLLTCICTVPLLLLAMPGRFGWWPLLFVALVPLLAFVARKEPRQSLSLGMLTGFFYQVGMLYWIVIVLGRYGGLPVAMSVPSMLMLAVYMGVYTALFAYLLGFILNVKENDGRVSDWIVIVAPLLWVGLDWFRSILFSGFPWMDLGYGLFSQPILLQIADLGGHHLVTFSLVLFNALLLLVVDHIRKRAGGRGGEKSWRAVSFALVFLFLAGGYSILRYHGMGKVVDGSPGFQVSVVQGNIPQDEKWTPERKRSTLDSYRKLSEEAVEEKEIALVVWPETALPFFPVNDPLFLSVTDLADSNNFWLLTGAPYFVLDTDLERPFNRAVSYYNSALLVDPEGNITSRYDKQHLVPFGEYVPFRQYLPWLEPLVESVGNFSSGRSSEPLPAGNARLGILICYESIFPSLARQEVAAGATLLVNITNDAWYGRSSAPYQSFAMSVLRAVETRRSLVRAANTGISGFVDPVGRIMDRSPIFESLAQASSVPLLEEKSIFTRFGYLFGPACFFLVLLMLVQRCRRK